MLFMQSSWFFGHSTFNLKKKESKSRENFYGRKKNVQNDRITFKVVLFRKMIALGNSEFQGCEIWNF